MDENGKGEFGELESSFLEIDGASPVYEIKATKGVECNALLSPSRYDAIP